MTASWAEPFRIITTFWLTNLLWTSKRRELRLKEKEVSSLRSSGLPVAWRNWYLSQGVGLKLLTYPLFSISQETMQSFSKCSFFFFFFLVRGGDNREIFFFPTQQFHINLSSCGKLLWDVKLHSHYSSQYLCCLQSITSGEAHGKCISSHSESGWQRYEHLIKISFISWK